MRHQLVNTVLKWMYALILGYLFREQSAVALTFFRIEDFVLALLTLCFFAGFILYLVTSKKHFLILSVSFYLIYSVLMVWQTFLFPLVSPQEYIAAIVVSSVLGVPMLFMLTGSFKHNKQRQRTHKSAPLL